ncbi:thermonuclease family protein [Planctobacterium marinum]|uniref:TNase-like domain-containing protein n=1 Tax=Planctobacterium marinum TaxID=1631968 RepID=A0AA48HYJ9_9ALTE|nr:hypothetical protein MACH26_24910 [Planctobacterium marinum]
MHITHLNKFAVALAIKLLLLVQSCSPDPDDKLVVKRVVDGDSLIITENGSERTLELVFVDAPEREQPFGREAKAFLESLLLNKAINLSESGEVLLGEQNVNKALLQAGMAWLSPQTQNYQQQFSFSEAQSEAMNSAAGLWSLSHELRIPPWVWREQSKHPSRPKQRPLQHRINDNANDTGNGNDN